MPGRILIIGLGNDYRGDDAVGRVLARKLQAISTHAFSVAEAVELARALNQLPPRLIVYGIEGKNFDSCVGLSPEVKLAVEEVFCRVKEELCTNSRS